ncbi:hypothetical protein PVBG_05933 [Plasmodium vivax Brazil I]|uniref:Variable surface protein Vir35 n=1 Tax=Plasmodium vivax (strain Brazil I) TaxID=1033975 RepID=A0A0J9SL57_PLAV1|nr:hypothetical protein PVBG_05933 [Plasmodium vivax Brazil I]
MELVKNYNIKDRIKIVVLLKFFTYIFLVLNPINDRCSTDKFLELKFNKDRQLNINYNRLLAKHELGKELRYTGLRENFSDNNMDNRKKNVAQNVSKYSQIKGIESNNFDAYMKDYKRRYGEKKGLYKLDCYCEKKVFNKIHHIDEIAQRFKNDNKSFKKCFLIKYGIGLIFFALIPALGLILPILFGVKEWGNGIYNICNTDDHYINDPGAGCSNIHPSVGKNGIDNIWISQQIFSFIMIIVVFVVIIYIWIKFKKYQKLKTGKRKMKIK